MKTLWKARFEPLEAVAVAATGGAARTLAQAVLARNDEELKLLRGVCWAGGVAFEGAFADLPWADGAVYLGRDARAPKFLWPSNVEPDAPLDLWVRALERGLAEEVAPPVLLLPDVQLLVSLAEARAVDRTRLEAWLSGSGG